MRYAYPCELTPEQDGGFSVSFPHVPEALTCGDDEADALAMAEDALAIALGAYVRAREEIPAPGPVQPGQVTVAVPLVVAAKLALYTAMREQGLSNVGLAARMGLSEGAIRKLLNPEHRSHIRQVEKALSKVDKRLVVEVGERPTVTFASTAGPDQRAAAKAAEGLRSLRDRVGGFSVSEMLSMRDEGRR
ncbi:MAG: type II toxin-antitoxin system HicB family antitoxin [Gemmatimonadota bacterium]|nr:type II toxin-antitoxin system HicB family antitoxin [Gemmatimonadota bacterium]